MKCQLRISIYCKKVISKKKTNYIDGKECCGYCFWLIRNKKKQERDKEKNKRRKDRRETKGSH